MGKITGNCTLMLEDYCANCDKFVPWVSKQEYPDNDSRGYLIERKEYYISCRHDKVCEGWAFKKQ